MLDIKKIQKFLDENEAAKKKAYEEKVQSQIKDLLPIKKVEIQKTAERLAAQDTTGKTFDLQVQKSDGHHECLVGGAAEQLEADLIVAGFKAQLDWPNGISVDWGKKTVQQVVAKRGNVGGRFLDYETLKQISESESSEVPFTVKDAAHALMIWGLNNPLPED
jgi:hypothetical protein